MPNTPNQLDADRSFLSELEEHESRVQNKFVGRKIYQDFLTDEERLRVGPFEQAFPQGLTVGLAELRSLPMMIASGNRGSRDDTEYLHSASHCGLLVWSDRMPQDTSLKLTDREIAGMFTHPVDAERYPPVMTLDEGAKLLRISTETLRDWRSRGLLTECSRKIGKHVRLCRDRLLKKVFNDGLRAD